MKSIIKKKTLFITLLVLSLLCTVALFAYAVSTGTKKLTVNATSGAIVEIYVDGNYKCDAPFNGTLPEYSEIKLVNKSENFMFFAYENGNTMGEGGEYTFTLTSPATVTAYCKNTDESKVQIIYRNDNSTNQVLATVVHNAADLELNFKEHIIPSASKFGYEFVSWDKTVTDVVSEAKGGAGTVIVSPVYKIVEATAEIKVVGGTITADGTNSGLFSVNSNVEISASTPEAGKKFAYWTNKIGTVISDLEKITVPVAGDEIYTAHYIDENEKTDLAPSIGISAYYDSSKDRIVTYTTRFLPDGYKLVSCGLIYAKDTEKTESGMTLDAVDGNIVKLIEYGNSSKKSHIILNRISCDDYVCLRAYLIYTDSENVKHTIYSDFRRYSKTVTENVIYNLTFDNVTLPNGINIYGSSISDGVFNAGNGCLSIPLDLSSFPKIKLTEKISFSALPVDGTILISNNGHFKLTESGNGIELVWSELTKGTPDIKSKDIVSVDKNGYLCLYDHYNEETINTGKSITAEKEYQLGIEYDIRSQKISLYIDDSPVASANYSYSEEDLKNFVFDISGKYCMVDDIKVSVFTDTSGHTHKYKDEIIVPTCVK